MRNLFQQINEISEFLDFDLGGSEKGQKFDCYKFY